MSTERIDLNDEAPDAAKCEACRDRFVERLLGVGGVRAVRPGDGPQSLHVDVDGSNADWRDHAGTIGASLADGLSHASLKLGNLDCPKCAESIAASVGAMRGVLFASASFVGRELVVEYDPSLVTPQETASVVRKLGFTAEIEGLRHRGVPVSVRLGITGLLFGLGLVLGWRGWPFAWSLLLPVVLAEGLSVFRGAAVSLRRRSINMNVLMSVAIVGAAGLGDWGEAAAVAWLAAVGGLIEDWATRRTRSALDSLLSLSAPTARVVSSGAPREVRAERVAPGEEIEVHAGERFPLDGEVLTGYSDANEAPITGESVPAVKEPGSNVFAGSVNLSGTLRVRVTRSAANTALARMVRLIEQAQERRAPIQTTIDRFAAIYTPLVVLLAGLLAIVPPLASGAAWQPWIYRGLWLLIVACPCALIISTPVAVVSAIGAASRMGALIKGGSVLEALGRARAIVFDKTGTLTHAELAVSRLEPAGSVSETDLLSLAAAVERHSSHPAALSIVREAARREIAVPNAESVRTTPGMGIEGSVSSAAARVGRPSWLGVDARLEAGETAVAVEREGHLLGVIFLADRPRGEAKDAIRELAEIGVGTQSLLSGDNQETSRALGQALGIPDAAGGLLPEDKERRVRELAERHGTVLMVGDGINDLAAMQAATVGVAMGVAGTDAAVEHADVVLMSDHLAVLPGIIRLSRRAVGVMRQNIAVALATKLALVALAVPFSLPLWLAVAGDVGVSVVVTLNAARLLFRGH